MLNQGEAMPIEQGMNALDPILTKEEKDMGAMLLEGAKRAVSVFKLTRGKQRLGWINARRHMV